MSDELVTRLLTENELLKAEIAELRLQVHELAKALKTYMSCTKCKRKPK